MKGFEGLVRGYSDGGRVGRAAGLAAALVEGVARRTRSNPRGLPMDEAARRARAESLGYDLDDVRYHGTSADADFRAFRQKDRGIWTTDDPREASSYALQNDSRGVGRNEASRVIPVVSRAERVEPISAEAEDAIRTAPGFSGYQRAQADAFRRARHGGADAVDMGGGVRVELDARNLRVPHATFDPERAREADLLAGAAGGALGLAELLEVLGEGEQDAFSDGGLVRGLGRAARRAATRLTPEEVAELPVTGPVAPLEVAGDDIRARRQAAVEWIEQNLVGRQFPTGALGDQLVEVPGTFPGKFQSHAGDDMIRGLSGLPLVLRDGATPRPPTAPDDPRSSTALFHNLMARLALDDGTERGYRATVRDEHDGRRLLDDFGLLGGGPPAAGAGPRQGLGRADPAMEGRGGPAAPSAGGLPRVNMDEPEGGGFSGGGRVDALVEAMRGPVNTLLNRVVRERPIGISAPPEAAEGILRDGEFLTQFETGTSRGALGLPRINAERDVFGLPEDAGPMQRPIYGALRTARPEEAVGPLMYRGGDPINPWQEPEQYGRHVFLLRPEAKARSTYTWGDSLSLSPESMLGNPYGEASRVWSFDEPVAEADRFLVEPGALLARSQLARRRGNVAAVADPDADTSWASLQTFGLPYIETQTRRPVGLRDVEALLIPGRSTDRAILRQADRRGIPTYTHDEVAADPELQRALRLRAAAMGGAGLGAAAGGDEGDEDGFSEGGRVGRIIAGLRAFHGSPHRFDRFDISRIGTGEGNQAYGHGLYFAEDEAVARSYRDQLAGPDPVAQELGLLIRGARRRDDWTEEALQDYFRNGGNFRSAALRAAVEDPEVMGMATRLASLPPGNIYGDESPEAVRLFSRLDTELRRVVPRGHMYEVDLGVPEDRMLASDRRLERQPGPVQEIVRGLGFAVERMPSERDLYARGRRYFEGDRARRDYKEDVGIASSVRDGYRAFRDGPEAFRDFVDRNPGNFVVRQGLGERVRRAAQTGEDVYSEVYRRSVPQPISHRPSLRGGMNPAMSSALLREAGIPGLSYLDAGSRRAGDGTRNFVMFDDEPIEILRRYARGGVVGDSQGGAAEGLIRAPAPPVGNLPGAGDEVATAQHAAARGLGQAAQMWRVAEAALGGGQAF